MVERVVASRFDGVENSEAAAAEHFKVDTEAPVDHFCERIAFGEKLARTSDEIFHQRNVAIAELARDDFVFADAVLRGHIERNIDAAFFEIARNVLPEVGKLQRRASRIGKLLTLRVAVTAKIKHETADGIRGIEAVADHLVPSLITLGGLILAEGFQ